MTTYFLISIYLMGSTDCTGCHQNCLFVFEREAAISKNTERYRKSSIPYMQRLLNEEDNMIKSISYASELCQDPDSITIENLNYL